MNKVTIYTDGGSRGNPGPAGAGAVIKDENGKIIKQLAKYFPKLTNNEAEYEGLLLGLSSLKRIYGKENTPKLSISVMADSELMVKQLNGEYQIKEERLVPYFIKIWNMRVKDFKNITFTHVKRENNKEADRLANDAMDNTQTPLL